MANHFKPLTYYNKQTPVFLSFLTTGFRGKFNYPYCLAVGDETPTVVFLEEKMDERHFLEQIYALIHNEFIIHYAGDRYLFPLLKSEFYKNGLSFPEFESLDLYDYAKSKKDLLSMKHIGKTRLYERMGFDKSFPTAGECVKIYEEFQQYRNKGKTTLIYAVEEEWLFTKQLFYFLQGIEEQITMTLPWKNQNILLVLNRVECKDYGTIVGMLDAAIPDAYYFFPEFTMEIKNHMLTLNFSIRQGMFNQEHCVVHHGYYLEGIESLRKNFQIAPDIYLIKKEQELQFDEIKDLILSLWMGL